MKITKDVTFTIPVEVEIPKGQTVCPFCFVALDMGQFQMKTKFGDSYELPILHYPELLCIALGVETKDLAFNTHRTKVDSLLTKL